MSNIHPSDLALLIAQYTDAFHKQYRSAAVPAATTTTTSKELTQEPPSKLTDSGRLQVRVSAENEAVPLVGASVLVTHRDSDRTELIRSMTTDVNGLTPLVDLPTKDRSLSLSSENIAPYAVYDIEVTADGYIRKRFTDLPIYGGVTAVQSVSMIPLPEAGDNSLTVTYPQSDE